MLVTFSFRPAPINVRLESRSPAAGNWWPVERGLLGHLPGRQRLYGSGG